MNDLAIVVEKYGRVGSVEKLLPDFVSATDESGNKLCAWSSAVGMAKINRIESFDDKPEISNELLASIIVTRDTDGIDIMEFHGVMFFKPLHGQQWHEQISSIKTRPSLFEVVPVTRIESGKDYVFFARRAARSSRCERRTLEGT